ncbi:hypothetical protein DFJ58DRAFT_643416, partial [Suillus subalutaceus]|uniref:uncharacterized protein n=1 Tax=Suillus subalutaceus TaxID=48586 RepID=UPI001B86C6F7
GLRHLELTDQEWEIAEQLRDILKDATLFFSRSTPNLATVILAMDLIDEKLTTYSQNQWFLPSIRAAVGLGKRTLNRYYQLTDTSEVYRIAMVLHPRHKLAYFRHAKWEDDWVETAKTLVRETYEHSY